MDKDITIYDIATEAGVSPATVSRVINESGYVGLATQKKVEAVIAKYNFKPSAIAKGLINKHTHTIGMLVPDIRNAYYSTIFVAFEVEAAKFGYNVMLCNSLNSLDKDITYLDMLVQKQVDVIIELGGQMDRIKPEKRFREKLLPIMERTPFFGTGYVFGEKQLHIDIDDTKAMRVAIEAEIARGHKSFAMIGGDPAIVASKIKHDEFTAILKEHGIAPKNRVLKKTGGYNQIDGVRGVRQLVEDGFVPEVLFGINEMAAIGIAAELAAQGCGKREIIGFDNTYLSEVIEPKLTCIGIDYNAYAKKAMEMIQGVLENEAAPRSAVFDSELIIRGSALSDEE